MHWSSNTPPKTSPLGDSITVTCRVRRAPSTISYPCYDEGVDMFCAMIQSTPSAEVRPSSAESSTSTSSSLSSSSSFFSSQKDAIKSNYTDMNNSIMNGKVDIVLGGTLVSDLSYNCTDSTSHISSVKSIATKSHSSTSTSSSITTTEKANGKAGPAFLFKPVPQPPSRTRTRASSTSLQVFPSSIAAYPGARRFHSAPEANGSPADIHSNVDTPTAIDTNAQHVKIHTHHAPQYSNSITSKRTRQFNIPLAQQQITNNSLTNSGNIEIPKMIKRSSLNNEFAAACFATVSSFNNEMEENHSQHQHCERYFDPNFILTTASSTNSNPANRANTTSMNNLPTPFHVNLHDIKHVEFIKDQPLGAIPLRTVKKAHSRGNRGNSKSSSLPNTTSKSIHQHSLIVTISTFAQYVELTFYNRQSKDLVIAFLRSTLPKGILHAKTLSPAIIYEAQNRVVSSNSREMTLAPGHSSRSLSVLGSDSNSDYDMDNFEDMAVKERFRNESFLEKMQRRCARWLIRAEEACICFDCSPYKPTNDDFMKGKDVDHESTVNTSIMSDRDFDITFDDEHDHGDYDENTNGAFQKGLGTTMMLNEESLELEYSPIVVREVVNVNANANIDKIATGMETPIELNMKNAKETLESKNRSLMYDSDDDI